MDISCTHRRRLGRVLPAMVLLGCVGGCAELAGDLGAERGFSGRDAEWARTSVGDFSVVSANHARAVISALGQQVAVEPANGFCLSEEAIETSERSAFLLLGDCALEDPGGSGPPVDGALDLPGGVPGIITVTISGDPGFSRLGGEAGNLADLQSFVESSEGRALLGRGGDGDQVSVADTRRIGSTLYVLVEDGNGGVPVLAPRFWRAFLELNQRLAVVTISGFRDRPLAEEEMLRHLGDQVRQLQVANSEPVNETPVQLAGSPRQTRASAWRAFAAARTEEELIEEEAAGGAPLLTDLRPTSIIVATETGEQDFWPVPERRGIGRPGQAALPGQGGPDAGEGSGSTALLPPPRPLPESRERAPTNAPPAPLRR